jgi:UDP-N-acetyl-D-mannosaminuronic acid dehydrogenase
MSKRFETVVVVGLGYIGLPTAAVIASRGTRVIGVDINAAIVEQVQSGRVGAVEPGLAELVAETVAAGQLTAQSAMAKGDAFVIAVPTPFEGGFKPDLSYVRAAALAVAPALAKGNLVLVESTIPVGTTEQVARWLAKARPDLGFSQRNGGSERPADVLVAHSPERILPGHALRELIENDRVIGGVCQASAEAACELYRSFVTGECVATDSRTAELCKLSENAFRDVNIAFANELALVCGELDVDVWELIGLANRHPRVNVLRPGPGVGGHCIAVDPWFIVSALSDKARLMMAARWINNGRPRQVVEQVLAAMRGRRVRSIACLGLAYKADIDDVRESPAVEVTALLAHELEMSGSSIEILVAEPHLEGRPLPNELQDSRIRAVETEAALEADVVVMLVDHRQFRAIPEARLAGKVLVDTRGVWPLARRKQAWRPAVELIAAE